MEPSDVVKMEYKELATWTDNFSEKNYIGRFQYGKLYRGKKNLADMIVKIWEVPETCSCTLEDNELRLMDELIFLRHQLWNRHPGIPWIFGYCFDGVHVGAVYELESNPLDSFFNLIPKGFSWVQRIKAALELAALLKFLHTEHGSFCPPIVINNLDAAHLLLDEEYRVKLCDFGWITGGIFPATRLCLGNDTIGCYGYTDVDSSCSEQFSNKQDVFAFGVILLSLISKRVCTGEDRDAGVPFVYEWARRESEAFEESESNMKDTNFSLVHESLAVDDGFWFDDGHKVTKLALECVNKDESQRPDVEKIFEFISRLKVVKQNSAFFKPSEKLRQSEVLWRRAREMKLGSSSY